MVPAMHMLLMRIASGAATLWDDDGVGVLSADFILLKVSLLFE